MKDPVRENIITVMAYILAQGVQHRASLRRNFKEFRSPHPSLNPFSGRQTVELPLEDYEAIATLATTFVKAAGYEITVTYDSSDGNRAFVAKLR